MVLIVVGVLLCLVNRFIPMAGSTKTILNVVVVIVVVLWLLNLFGLFHAMSRMHLGDLKMAEPGTGPVSHWRLPVTFAHVRLKDLSLGADFHVSRVDKNLHKALRAMRVFEFQN